MTSLLVASQSSALQSTRALKSGSLIQMMPSKDSQRSSSSVNVKATAQVVISPSSSNAAELLESARAFIKKESLQPFEGYDKPFKNEARYINVDKFNNYVVKKAYDELSKSAESLGIKVDPNQTMEALNSAKPSVGKVDAETRARLLGPSSTLTELSGGDLDSMTNLYIKAKESGANTDMIEVVASEIGSDNYYNSRGIIHGVLDENGNEIGANTKAIGRGAASIKDTAVIINNALQDAGVFIKPSVLENMLKMQTNSSDVASRMLAFLRDMSVVQKGLLS